MLLLPILGTFIRVLPPPLEFFFAWPLPGKFLWTPIISALEKSFLLFRVLLKCVITLTFPFLNASKIKGVDLPLSLVSVSKDCFRVEVVEERLLPPTIG